MLRDTVFKLITESLLNCTNLDVPSAKEFLSSKYYLLLNLNIIIIIIFF